MACEDMQLGFEAIYIHRPDCSPIIGDRSKPCSPGQHQNQLVYMDVHPETMTKTYYKKVFSSSESCSY